MYELIILSLLMRYPLHAYRMAKIANEMIGPWEAVSRGTLSVLLAKLEKARLIREADPAAVPFSGGRPSRAYGITEAGRNRFFDIMRDTTSNRGNYQKIFHMKALHLDFLPLRERIELVEHYLNYCRTARHHMEVEMQDFAEDPMERKHATGFFAEAALDLMQHTIRQWQIEMDWTESLRNRVVMDLKPAPDA